MPPLRHLHEKFLWFPSIDYDACLADLKCLNFCPHDVFEWDPKTGRPFVAHPYRCLPGCESASKAAIPAPFPCPPNARSKPPCKDYAAPSRSPHLAPFAMIGRGILLMDRIGTGRILRTFCPRGYDSLHLSLFMTSQPTL